jgi:hypothetical protein
LIKRFLKLTAIITPIHTLITIICIAISFGEGMARFDYPERSAELTERVCGFVANIFVQPVFGILGRFEIKTSSSLLEWTALGVNSLIWGAVIALIISWLRSRSANPAPQANNF